MTIVITDPKLLEQLVQAQKTVDIRDGNGNFIGTFARPVCAPPPGYKSPFTDEQIEEFRKQPDGRRLEEIIRDLEKQG
jgi:hypothetical protein